MTRERVARAARRVAENILWIAPVIAGLLCLRASLSALHSLTYATLGRDQGIFQYVAWALRNGEKAYRDFHEINGPLPHAWNLVIQAVGGEDEHVFRSVDTTFVIVVYGAAALTVPRWVGATASLGIRAAWTLAGVTVLGAQFARYDWWHANQREGLYAALLLGSLALQAVAHDTRENKRAMWLFGLSALTTSLTWFGKPPCVVFSLLQLFVLVFDRAAITLSMRRIVVAVAAGVVVASASMLAFVLRYEDLTAGVSLLSKVPLLHHTIWNHSLVDCYRAYDNAPRLDWALATVIGFCVAYFVFGLPRRALLALVLPIGGFIVFAGQGKGFPYHLHMMTLGTSFAQLVILAAIAHRGHWRRDVVALIAVVASAALGLKSRDDARLSAAARSSWADLGSTPEKRASRAYFEAFGWGDFFAADLRAAAAVVRERTKPEDRIQTYGLDPYFLFLARRQTASPVIYNFELNIDPALEGGTGAKLTAAQRVALRAHRDAAERLVLDRAKASPPAAFVFFDNAPFSHPEDGEKDFAEHCPELYRWVDERYLPAEKVGSVRLRFRR